MADLYGGVFLGAIVAKLLDFVIDVAKRTTAFKSILKNFEITLTSLNSTFNEINKLGLELDLDNHLRDEFTDLFKEIKSVVGKCSDIVLRKAKHAKKLEDLEAKLLKFFQLNVQAQLWSHNLLMLKGMKDLEQKIDRLAEDSSSHGIQGSGARGSKPELPSHKVIGLDEQDEELKKRMLEDDVPVVITAMGGSGKTKLQEFRESAAKDFVSKGMNFAGERFHLQEMSRRKSKAKKAVSNFLQRNYGL